MKVGVLFSGGKDSSFAALVASRENELACLVTLVPRSESSYMFHFPDIEWTGLQAEAMGVPQLTWKTEGVKEEELEDLRLALASAKDRFALRALYTGALASEYQKTRVERICGEVGLDCISPLWHADPSAHLSNLLKEGFEVVVVSVSALGLDERWLGRTLDAQAVGELTSLASRYRFHAGLEGGEGETFVLDSPLFRKRVELLRAEKHWLGDRGYLQILEARLVPKLRS